MITSANSPLLEKEPLTEEGNMLSLHFVYTLSQLGIAQRYTKLYSFRFSCRIVSLTAAKTNLMFSVSVAHVK